MGCSQASFGRGRLAGGRCWRGAGAGVEGRQTGRQPIHSDLGINIILETRIRKAGLTADGIAEPSVDEYTRCPPAAAEGLLCR
jgi:hypothetical protein